MTTLENPRHEAFCQHFARYGNATQAYVNAGYSRGGAEASASRLLTNAKVCARVDEIKSEIFAGTIKAAICDRNARVGALQDRWERMRAVIDARSKDTSLAGVAGGDTGIIYCSSWRIVGSGEFAEGKGVYEIDTGLLRELREHEKQAAEELGQWAGKLEVSGPDGGPIEHSEQAKTLAEALSPEELEALKAKLEA